MPELDLPAIAEELDRWQELCRVREKGLTAELSWDISPEIRVTIESLMEEYRALRHTLLVLKSNAQDLGAKGYPVLPTATAPADQVAEIKAARDEINVSAELIVAVSTAATFDASFSEPVPKD